MCSDRRVGFGGGAWWLMGIKRAHIMLGRVCLYLCVCFSVA